MTFLDPFGDPAFLPPADVNENAGELVIRVELPGVRKNEVAVFVQGENIEVLVKPLQKRELEPKAQSFQP